VQSRRDATRAGAEAPSIRGDARNGQAILVEVVDQLEKVLLGLHRVDLAVVTIDGNFAREVHLVLLVVRVLLIVRLRAAHLVVRTREQLAQARRDGHFEVSDHDNIALVQCNPYFQLSRHYPRGATQL